MASLLLSFGTPMIRAGDEILLSHKGNNNVYAQDNEISWLNWKEISPAGKRMLALTKSLLAFRRTHAVMETGDFFNTDKCTWYRPDGLAMTADDWQGFVRSISCLIHNDNSELYFVFNAFDKEIKYQLPTVNNSVWRLLLDTSDTLRTNEIYREFMMPAWSVAVFETVAMKQADVIKTPQQVTKQTAP